MNDTASQRQRQFDHDSLGSAFFAAMTTDQQEIFALELTHCQLTKANRKLFNSNLVVVAPPMEQVQCCAVGMGTPTPYPASSCFPLMSEYAFGLYNTMFLHTQEVCAILTEERRMQKEVITHMLVGASTAVSQQMQNVLGKVTSVSEKLNEHSTMIEDMTIQTSTAFEQLQAEAVLMAEHHKAHERAAAATMEQMTNQTSMVLERVQEEVTFVIAEQQKAHEHATAMVLEKVEMETVALIVQQHKSHERASALHIEEITQQTAKILERMQVETATIVAEQADKIKEQDYVIKRMNELLLRANEQMKPLSSIELIVKMAEDGFAALKVLVNFVLSMFIAWMITMPPVLRSSRRYVYLLFSISLVVEMSFMLWLSENDQSLEGTGINGHRVIRTWTRLAAVLILILFPMVSCFSPPVNDTKSSITMEDLVKVQMDLLAKLNEKIPAVETQCDELIPVSGDAAKLPACAAARVLNGERNIYDSRRDDVPVPVRNMEKRSFQSPLMEQVAPVVTPTKRRAGVNNYGIANPTLEVKPATFYPNGFALEYMLEKGNDGDCSSSGDDASVAISSLPSKSNNKRTVSDLYSSGSDSSDYFSTKDEEMSDSSDSTVDPSPMKKRKEEEPHEVDDHEVRVY